MGTSRKIKLGILSSSRADFGIYLPLLKAIQRNSVDFHLSIIVFGTHLSTYHGYTKVEIEKQGFEIAYEIPSLLLTDDPQSISTAYALTAMKFADFWATNQTSFDWVICLGDRFEMAAAVAAGIPFGVRFAHIHGGETTLGAIDNIYRHSITLASQLHFVANKQFKSRIIELTGHDAKCYVTGSLSLDNIEGMKFLSKKAFQENWGINIHKPYILVTVHPETIAIERNKEFAREIIKALEQLLKERQIIITLPNADTVGSIYRNAFNHIKNNFPKQIHLIENFGTQSYFTCIKYADFLIGNTSSGIIEAASFHKYVINLGDRQLGRLASENIIHVKFDHLQILSTVKTLNNKFYSGRNIYKIDKAAPIILEALKINY